MTNLAEKVQAEEAFLEGGAIVSALGKELTVELAGRRVVAQRATMCLVEPQIGDHVLVATLPTATFVMGVLSRDEQAPAKLSFDGDVDFAVRSGRLRVAAQEGVDVATPGDGTIDAQRLSVRAEEGDVIMGKLRMIGSVVEAKIGKLSTVAETVDAFAERFVQRVKRYYRLVEEMDQVRAEQIDHRARGTARLHAENAVITANKLAKIDGDQVHIG